MQIMRAALILLSGILFGAGLAISQMTDPQRVIAFLDVGGAWDPTLAFVMAGAFLIFATFWRLLQKRGRGLFNIKLPDMSADPISSRLIIGSTLFGIGWGLGGFCPGPALANLMQFAPETITFVITMLIGMVIAQRTCSVDK